MKFSAVSRQEKSRIDRVVEVFGGFCPVSGSGFFLDKFNRVYMYTGKILDLNAYAFGLNAGKLADTFSPTLDFVHFIKPEKNIFLISTEDDALKFMAGHDMPTKEVFEEGSFVAVKFNSCIIGVGKFNKDIIKNKLPKDRKIRIQKRQENEEDKEAHADVESVN